MAPKLLDFAPWNIGGSSAFVSHLATLTGWPAVRRPKLRELSELEGPLLFCAGDPKLSDEVRDELLSRPDVWWVCHDPREFRFYSHWDPLGRSTPRVVVIRETLLPYFDDVVFIPHPYSLSCRSTRGGMQVGSLPVVPRTQHAISTARSASPKRTQWILEANDVLPHELRVKLYGEPERWWWFNHCKPRGIPRWTGHEQGTGPQLAAGAQWLLDCTVYRGDGGGTQYTWLEAMDSGALPVCSVAWTGHPGPFLDGRIAHRAVDGPEAIVSLLRGPLPTDRERAQNRAYLMATHTTAVARAYTSLLLPKETLKRRR